jgi:hypothetical protein
VFRSCLRSRRVGWNTRNEAFRILYPDFAANELRQQRVAQGDAGARFAHTHSTAATRPIFTTAACDQNNGSSGIRVGHFLAIFPVRAAEAWW